ncbi:MAG: UDP-N-acetylmuramoyl-tripeptide--D-alanyl-D-alanine ligase [Candidatus Gastranaerophilales bacterium]|nr:UDP-N-acetylmuramoyl-tripeptide--D-alanyl-D-alanine ligase [Candidatus Gastranaerophilales bacterium]
MKFQVKNILEITNGKLLRGKDISGDYNLSTDTRNITSDEIFWPLIGENFDGHNFINTALANGVRGYLIDKNHKNFVFEEALFVIKVEDTLKAYLQLANFAKNQINPVVIAVTGSSGKTTTKEMIYSVLSQQYHTHKSKLNHNNEIGLCQTMLGMPDNTEFLVVEMGMRGIGEIELLSKYAQPNIAVITNIGTAHIGRLGSREKITKAKCEIINYLNKEGTLISYDEELVKNNIGWKGKTIYYSLDSVNITKQHSDSSEFFYKKNAYKLNVSGEYNIINSLAAIEIGLLARLSFDKISEGLALYRPIDNRWQVIDFGNNIQIINDSYNANPDSVKAAIKAVISSYPNKKIVLVLGDMAELGKYEESLHKEIGDFLKNKPIFEVITVGEKAELITKTLENEKFKIKSFTRNDEVVEYLSDTLVSESIVLLKASRCMSFENIVEKLKNAGVN